MPYFFLPFTASDTGEQILWISEMWAVVRLIMKVTFIKTPRISASNKKQDPLSRWCKETPHNLVKAQAGQADLVRACPCFPLNHSLLCPIYFSIICWGPEWRHIGLVNRNLFKIYLPSREQCFHFRSQTWFHLTLTMRSSCSASFSLSFSCQLGDGKLGERFRNELIFKFNHPQTTLGKE